jgi:hypothetical protein
MTYRNDITYTLLDPRRGAHVEQTMVLYHERPLTTIGAQRIIRRDTPDAIVTRIQHASITG